MEPRTAYDDLATPARMARDGRVAGRRLHLLEQAAGPARRPAPPLGWETQPREVRKPEIDVDLAAARLAARLYAD